MNVVCPVCGKENQDQARFCMHCSGALNQVCGHCGATMPLKARFCQRCGQAMAQQVPSVPNASLTGRLQPSTTLSGRYRIVRKLGQGGMGAVYLVNDLRLPGKEWAIKEMSDAAITDPIERQQAVQGFQQEAQMLAMLDHANLPKVTDYFSEGGNQYLVMEYVMGQTLEATLERTGGPLPEKLVITWAEQLCDVLAYLHNQHPPIIFRDLKPGNIMVQPDGKVKLIDFGIARHFKPGQRKDTQAFGTPGYSPPEQHGKGQTDARSDVYALGATLHHLLSGNDPNLSPFHFNAIRTYNSAVSSTTDQTIMKAVALRSEDRWQTMAALRKALTAQATLFVPPMQSVYGATAVTPMAARVATPAVTPSPTIASLSSAPLPISHPDPGLLLPGFSYASYGKRIAANLIDSFIVFMVYMISAVVDEFNYTGGGIFLLGSICILAYWIWPTAKTGKTLGKKWMGIQIVRKDGSPPGWGRSIMRYIGTFLEAVLFYVLVGFLGYLWPLWDKNKQAWHDKIAGTYVVDS